MASRSPSISLHWRGRRSRSLCLLLLHLLLFLPLPHKRRRRIRRVLKEAESWERWLQDLEMQRRWASNVMRHLQGRSSCLSLTAGLFPNKQQTNHSCIVSFMQLYAAFFAIGASFHSTVSLLNRRLRQPGLPPAAPSQQSPRKQSPSLSAA